MRTYHELYLHLYTHTSMYLQTYVCAGLREFLCMRAYTHTQTHTRRDRSIIRMDPFYQTDGLRVHA